MKMAWQSMLSESVFIDYYDFFIESSNATINNKKIF